MKVLDLREGRILLFGRVFGSLVPVQQLFPIINQLIRLIIIGINCLNLKLKILFQIKFKIIINFKF